MYEAVNYPVLLKLSVTPVLASVGVVSAAGLHSLGAGAVLERAEGWTDCLASRPSRSHQAQSSQLHNPCSRHTVVSSNQQQLFFLQGHYNIKTYLTWTNRIRTSNHYCSTEKIVIFHVHKSWKIQLMWWPSIVQWQYP